MPTNPIVGSHKESLNPESAANNPQVNVHKGHNTFDMSRRIFDTMRFGTYNPFMWEEVVPDSRYTLTDNHNLRAYTFKSPVMDGLGYNKDHFLVPFSSILPRNWDKIYRNPAFGDDVPSDAFCTFDFARFYHSYIDFLYKDIKDFGLSSSSAWLSMFFCFDYIFGRGSLLDSLGYPVLDKYFDSVNAFNSMGIPEGTFNIIDFSNPSVKISYTYKSKSDVRKFVVDYLLKGYIFDPEDENTEVWRLRCYSVLPESKMYWLNSFKLYFKHLSIAPLVAYHQTCAKFYSNDNVDSIYMSNLYNDNIQSLVLSEYSDSSMDSVPTFRYNGVNYQYDVFSQRFTDLIFADLDISKAPYNLNHWITVLGIFGREYTLIYQDFFMGCRLRPLAVGNVNISVNDNLVSAIDVTKNIVLQRYLNVVNRLGSKLVSYMRGMFGTSPEECPEPLFLSHQRYDVSTNETTNTSDNQGKQTSIVQDSQSSYAYDIFVPSPGIVIGIAYFTFPIVYRYAMSKVLEHNDRFSMFNPMMENIGDDAVKVYHFDWRKPFGNIFGYITRYGEYKETFDAAHGGFCVDDGLDSWLFSPNAKWSVLSGLNSDLIRYNVSDIDNLYSSLTGMTSGNYFHFIVKNSYKLLCNMPMSYNPGIL
ncbi:major capsid protein [Capybara microvirus Cap3_SP_332]|nr:major capsid protein [Capybara microvirus Cap3_SP_332]